MTIGKLEASREELDAEREEELLLRRLAGRRSRIPRADRNAPLRLSFGQQQMWFLNRLAPDSPEYLAPLIFRLRGALSTVALTQAIDAVVARHEILRTRYAVVGAEPLQVIDPPQPVGRTVTDLRGVPAAQRDRRAMELAEQETLQGIDLAREWPIRVRMVRIADDDNLLVVVFHHIACDAWSLRVFEEELSALYVSIAAGRPDSLPPPAIQYADYAAYQRAQFDAGKLDRHLGYWLDHLTGLIPCELATDRPRPEVRGWQGAAVPVTFRPGLSAAVREVAKRHDVTVFVVLLAAFQALLARYTGSTDIAVGTVASERKRPELQRLIGYGINSLVMRTRWSRDSTFAGLLASTRATVLDAFDHQDAPFARLVDQMEPERDRSRTPLFRVAFTTHEPKATGMDLPGVRVESLEAPWQVAKFDLTLQVEESLDGSLRGQLEYATALFDRAAMQRLAGHLERLLAHATAAPQARAGTLEILGTAELAVVAGAGRQAPQRAPGGRRGPQCLPEAFEEQARATPDAAAVIFGEVHLTYAELNARANKLAHHLRAMGITPDALVGVALDRSADLVVALLAVLKAGAAYLPLDPSYPADRLAFMLSDAGTRVVVTQERHATLVALAYDGSLVVVDRDAAAIGRQPAADPPAVCGPDNLIYVIYTSGSTGRPKGMCLTHGNVLRLFATTREQFAFGAADVWTMFHSYAFDFSVWEMWGALLYGGRLVVVPFDTARSPDDFLNLLLEHRVTVLNQTPAAFHRLVRAAADGDARVDRLALRVVIFGGEKLEISELRPWAARRGLRWPALVNMYGITETTVHVTYHQVTERDLAPAAGAPIGAPLGDLWIVLLDRFGNVAPIGVPAEICVGGAGVGRGYLNRAALTAERFVPDPVGPPGSRLYRSGDLAFRRADGTLEFLGRIDDQVKIRGYRIELGEIQAALRADPRLRDATVAVQEDAPGSRHLVAYVVPGAGSAPDPGELRATLAESLPDFMVPAVFVFLDRIPLTANGKVDRRALPAPDQVAIASVPEYLPPGTPAEQLVASVWRDVLGVAQVGRHDNFFDLGGDSIKAVVLAGGMRDAGLDVTVADLFKHRTVAELAGLAKIATSGHAPAQLLSLVPPFGLVSPQDRARLPTGVVDAYPLSQLQTGMVVEMLLDSGLNLYHNTTSFRIRDDMPLSPRALERAVSHVVSRHEALRTSIDLTGYSVPMQLVHAAAGVSVPVADLRKLTGPEQDHALRAFVAAERATLFDLATPPLVRVSAHICDDNIWWISITECHAVLEGWSYHSLLMEILDGYRRMRAGLEPEPVELPAVRYADFIASELDSLASADERAYWRSIVSSGAKLSLPADLGDGPDGPRAMHRARVPLHEVDDGLRALAGELGVPVKSVLLAAHLKVMSMLTDEPAFFTGLVCHGRLEAPGADRVCGLYLNTLPLVFVRGARTWRELVERVFAQETEMWAHRRFPMPEIQREMGGDRLIDVRFNYLDFHQVDTGLVDLGAVIDDSPTEFGLAVQVLAGHLLFTANAQVVSAAGMGRLAGMYRAVLAAIAADPDGDAGTTYLPPGERDRLLVDWNDTATRPVSLSVLELFEQRAAASPGAPAVQFEGGSLTYAQLDARANQFAHRLRGLGAGPESAVGVLLDRGPDLIACLLGVWKAGGAYVPVDPSFPVHRVASMLADAGARLAVTEPRYAHLIDDGLGVTVVDATTEPISGLPVTPPGVPADLDRLAYVIFTSGSTGRPKGVQITHRSLGNHVRWAAEELAARGTTGAPLFSSVAFDLVVPSLWAPLVTGQPVRLLPPGLDVADLGRSLAAHGPFSFIKLTPGHLDVLAGQLDDEQAAGLAAVIVVAGEALSGPAAGHWRRLLGPGRLINEYGPTEASVGTSTFPVTGPVPAKTVPIGRPLPGMTMYVLDALMQPVPVGVIGELYVGGTGVARGYAGRPEATAERFLPDPFGPRGARLYRSGDRARVRPDGAISFAGRIDDQVKVHGYRIEPGEIRATLLDHPDVRDAVVVAVGGSLAVGHQLAAYCVPARGQLPPAEELARHCAQRLPSYMIPAAFVPLDRIPLNSNGKVDRRALPAPDQALAAGRELVVPRDPLEERIAQAWRDVLGLDRIGVHDSFFELGGHSIRAVALVGALRAGGLDIGVRDVFAHRTIAELALAVSARTEPAAGAALVAPFDLIPAEDRARLPGGLVDAYPLSQVQRGMVIEMLADRNLNNYHNTTSFQVRDDRPFSLLALKDAAAVVAARHEMLRTSIELTGYSVPMQLVHATAEVPVAMLDLRDLDETGQGLALRRFNRRERETLFDLSRPPLQRMTALVQSERAWRLSFTQLHAITDGWSFHSLLMELLDCYQRLRDGREPAPYEAPAVRYADFVAAELRSLAAQEDRGHWQKIVGSYPKLTLPADWGDDPATPREDYRVAVGHADLAEGLRRLASQARASLKSVLHAAHLKVMSMLTPEPIFSSGLVCEARPEMQGADRVYGMHLNTVPFAFDGAPGTWLELVRRTFAREVELLPHCRFPMPAMVREMGGGGRLIDVLFTYQDFHQVDAGLIEVDATEGDDSTEFALGVPCTPRYLLLRSNTHMISRANAERLAGMYRAVLEAMAADAYGDARAACLAVGEREQLAAVCGGTGGRAVTRCLHEAFEERAAAAPGATAVVFGRDRLTYAEVNARANRIADRLRRLGIGPESLVGVCLDQGLDVVPALLGVLKAGAAYVPLPPSSPAQRLRFVLSDTAASVVVTRSEHAAALAACFDGTLVVLDSDEAAIAEPPGTDPVAAAGPGNLAYVIYTSGSTGHPKGVGVTHANVLRLFTAVAGRAEFAADQVWALLHSYAFDVSVWEMWGALLHGAAVVVVPPQTGQSPDELLSLLEEQQVTALCLSPVAFRALIAAAGGDDARLSRLALRGVMFGGDRLEASDLAEWVASQGIQRAVLAQGYGPTEATVHVTYHTLSAADLTGAGIPIGRPVDDMRVYVLDALGYPVPAGVPGELCASGPGVARGYVNRPALTAGQFVPDPYGPAGSRYYRTGDLVRRRPDGNLDFLGRIDDQIKVRGYRIEPGEIQAVLVGHPGIRAAVVAARGDNPAGVKLVAYCVPVTAGATEDFPAAAELAAHCAERLPDYMVPAAFVPIETIPLTVNGKLDKRALPAPDRASLWSGREYVPLRTETERQLAGIWSHVLGVGRVGADDRFFDLGGDSMMVLRAMSQAREIGLPLTLRMLYQHGSIAELADAVDSALGQPGGRGDGSGDLRLTPFQRVVARLAGRVPDHQQVRLLVAADVDARAIAGALRAAVAGQEAIRPRTVVSGGRGRRAAGAAAGSAVALIQVDVGACADDKLAVAVDEAAAEAGGRLDLAAGPVICAVLVRGGAARPAQLIIAAHEVVVDRASWPVLLADLQIAYDQLAAGLDAALPAPTASFRVWAGRLAEWAASAELTGQAHYWLSRAPHPPLPTDHADGANTVASERKLSLTLPAVLTAGLLKQRRPQEVLLAALAAVLARWTGADRLLVDVEGRPQRARFDDIDLSRVAGPFAHRFPLAVWVPPRLAARAVLRSVREQVRAVPDEGLGYGLLRYLPADPDLAEAIARLPAPQVRFGSIDGRAAWPAGAMPAESAHPFTVERIAAVRDPAAAREHLLEVEAVLEATRIQLTWTYSVAIHDGATAGRLVADYVAELTGLVDACREAGEPGETGEAGENTAAAASNRRRVAATLQAPVPSPLAMMERHHVPGASVAIFRDGEHVSVHAHGHLDARAPDPVTPGTLFRVASVSKQITALGALRLAAEGRLDLDEDVNSYLVSGRLPGTARPPITTRHLLANVAGLATTPAHEPYRHGEPMPTVLDALRGRPPARTPPVRPKCAPGELFEKNVNNYLVLEQLMTDLTGTAFPRLMQELIFEPLGMASSSFDPSFHETSGCPVARGHDAFGVSLPELGPAHPASAAGGLWTTAGDLAKAELEIRRAHLGQPALITASLAAEMLTPTPGTLYGLSTIVDFPAGDVDFGAVGEFSGYFAVAMCKVRSGDGFVLLTNGDGGREMEIARFAGEQFGPRETRAGPAGARKPE